MRVFVLCTGRCGSTTFTYACKHIQNFTAGHESRAKFIGAERLDYPDNHIEVDNRLSWFLGRLDQEYGDDAYYVHLTRDAREVAESYARRMDNPASIGAAHKRSILMNSPHDDLAICLDVVHTMRANIEHFLRGKSHAMRISIENVKEDFHSFWLWIGAQGDEAAALAEWKERYNDSENLYGAIRPRMPKTELATLREERSKLVRKTQKLRDAVKTAEGKAEQANQVTQEISKQRAVAERRCIELELQRSKLELLWLEEGRRLRNELANQGQRIAGLRNSVEIAKADRARSAALSSRVIKERDAFIKYSEDLETRYLRILQSRTWRVFGPYRLLMRKAREVLLRRACPPNSLPERPNLTMVEANTKKIARSKSDSSGISKIRSLDKRLWGGFSRSALRDLKAFKDDPQASTNDRSDAAYTLARWYSVQAEFEAALREIQDMRLVHPECSKELRQVLPEALFLCRLGKTEEARSVLEKAEFGFNPTIQLVLANTWNPSVTGASTIEGEEQVLAYLNSIYDHFGLGAVGKRNPHEPLSIDNLCGADGCQGTFDSEEMVTVIMPVFNAEDTISTALKSVAEQTWQNLEVLVVDDASTDGSVEIVSSFCSADRRFRLIRQQQNSGSYVCRNRALEEANGAFVTIHDSDDWSHPDKIRCQVQDLKANPGPYNLAMWVRTTSSLAFFGNSRTLHDLVRPDHSSGLFPIETFRRFGTWDAVRISADTELYWRIESLLGNKKWMFNRRQVLQGCPMSLGRMSDTSLTQSGATSVMTIYHGVRREYREAADFWHSRLKESAQSLTATNKPGKRESFFPVPTMIDSSDGLASELSILVVADWNTDDGVPESIVRLLQTRRAENAPWYGLFHYPRYHSDVSAPLNARVREFAWTNQIRIVAPGEVLDVDLVLVVGPKLLEHPMDRFPKIALRRLIILNDSEFSQDLIVPSKSAAPEGVHVQLIEFFGQEGEWVESLQEFSQVLEREVVALHPKATRALVSSRG